MRKKAEQMTGQSFTGKGKREIQSSMLRFKDTEREKATQARKKEQFKEVITKAAPSEVSNALEKINEALQIVAGKDKTTGEQDTKIKQVLGKEKYEQAWKEDPKKSWKQYLEGEKEKISTTYKDTGAMGAARKKEYEGLHATSFSMAASEKNASEKGQGIIINVLTQILKAIRGEENDLIGIRGGIEGAMKLQEAQIQTAKEIKQGHPNSHHNNYPHQCRLTHLL